MRVIAISNFVHGAYTLAKNEEADMPEAIARDLESANLVKVKQEKKSPEPQNKMADAPKNKAK